MKNAPKTIEELMKGRRWVVIRRLFKQHNATMDVSVSEENFGQYAKVVLDGNGFRTLRDKSGLVAAFTGNKPEYA